ncbi:tetratricopeptide repeat protein [Rhodovulum sp. 12E13]|uniref:tetratricopeptide repeat protein n=1 Tax=Rhodovulum sp. 12E13 TaxID=2203891 RepID=UPI001F4223FB|nr:tetratricopeptide repeat protein [Rhodovulum sp. 12E13]
MIRRAPPAPRPALRGAAAPLLHRAIALALTLCSATVAASQPAGAECPPATPDAAEESRLIDALRAAPDAAAARKFNAALWALWTDAPDARAQALLDRGMARLRLGDLATALRALDELVAYCPDYAEGYNQRAFARYLAGDYAAALSDLDAALARSPRHVGALSGKALSLMGLGQDRKALAALEAALALNPHLSERALLPVLKERLGAEDL